MSGLVDQPPSASKCRGTKAAAALGGLQSAAFVRGSHIVCSHLCAFICLCSHACSLTCLLHCVCSTPLCTLTVLSNCGLMYVLSRVPFLFCLLFDLCCHMIVICVHLVCSHRRAPMCFDVCVCDLHTTTLSMSLVI